MTVSYGFSWFADIADWMQGIHTVCQIDLSGCQVVAEFAGIHDIVCECWCITPRIQIGGTRFLDVGFYC